MDNISIRVACPNDAEALVNIYAPYVLNTAVSYEYVPPSVEEFRVRIEKTLEKYPYLVAECDGEILGYSYAGTYNSRMSASWSAEASIYIKESCRRAGLGKLLYSELEKLLARQNIVSLIVKIACCDREEDEHLSRDSIEFHTRWGYSEVGTIRNCGYKFGKWYGLMIMDKLIAEAKEHMPPMIPFSQLVKEQKQ